MVQACNPSSQEAKAKGWGVWGHPGLHFKTLRKKKKKINNHLVRMTNWQYLKWNIGHNYRPKGTLKKDKSTMKNYTLVNSTTHMK